MRFSRDSDSTISRPDASGTCAPTRPVLPLCGTIGVPVSLASRMMRLTSSTLPGRSTSGVAAMPEAAPLGEVRRDILLVAQRIFVADDCREAVDESGVEVLGYVVHGRKLWSLQLRALSRGAAARDSRSLIASPSPSNGIGSTAMVARAAAVELLHIGEQIARRFAQVA